MFVIGRYFLSSHCLFLCYIFLIIDSSFPQKRTSINKCLLVHNVRIVRMPTVQYTVSYACVRYSTVCLYDSANCWRRTPQNIHFCSEMTATSTMLRNIAKKASSLLAATTMLLWLITTLSIIYFLVFFVSAGGGTRFFASGSSAAHEKSSTMATVSVLLLFFVVFFKKILLNKRCVF